MDKMKEEVDDCVAILNRIIDEHAILHHELLRRASVERMSVSSRVTELSSSGGSSADIDALIGHYLGRYEVVLPGLVRQVQRVEKTLSKMARARPAMSWRVREIDTLLAELKHSGVVVTPEDISKHLWSAELDKLAAQ